MAEEEFGAVFRIRWDVEGEDQIRGLGGQLDGATEEVKKYNISARQAVLVTSHFIHGTMALAGAIIANSGATREQIKQYQILQAVVSAVLSIVVALRIAMSFAPGGGVTGGAGAASLLNILQHEGGYGSNRMQIIQSGERVVPAHRVTNNYGGGVTIQNLNISGSGGRELARNFTQELESQVQRGVLPSEWP
jgi:hypothetical protein